MKKRLLLLVISIVLQSCFSYKAVENNSSQYEIGKSYRVKQSKKDDIIRITSKTDSTLVVWSKFETKTIAIDEISKVEKRKFSIVKTVLLPISIAASLVLLFLIGY
jgi:hypothetical protein